MSQQGLWARGWALLPLPAFLPGTLHLAAAMWGHVRVCCLQLASIGVVNEEPARRALREMLFTAPSVESYISGVVRMSCGHVLPRALEASLGACCLRNRAALHAMPTCGCSLHSALLVPSSL